MSDATDIGGEPLGALVSAADLAADPAARAALERLTAGPLKPRPDNVTPPVRTPWGGRLIYGRYKAGLPGVPPARVAPVVGESWELSDDPAFPSEFALPVGGRRLRVRLPDLLAVAADRVLGAPLARVTGGRLPVMVKLIDAADNLSIQVHPPREHGALAEGESGKSEAWVVLDREPGAGLYLGLAPDVTRDALRAALEGGDDVREMLHFVAVDPGDVLTVPAGTVHAIGRGCLLLEIQRFSPPASGATYRLWDWNRRYDEHGRPDPAGRPRPLHLDQALRVIDFAAPRGAAGASALTGRPRVLRGSGGSEEVELVAGLDGLRLTRLTLAPGAPLPLPTGGRFVALTCTRGSVALAVPTGPPETRLRMGESALLPAALSGVELAADGWSRVYATTLTD